jgi:ferrochelatase
VEPPLDAVLIVSLGGPDKPDDVEPFIRRVLGNRPVPPHRVAEVARHYDAVGGRSPLVDLTEEQARALERRLADDGLPLPVFVGMRCSEPWLTDVVQNLGWRGYRQVATVIMSVHRDRYTWNQYDTAIAEAVRGCEGPAPHFMHVPAWHDHPLFVDALADRITTTLHNASGMNPRQTPLVFSVHSLPTQLPGVDEHVAAIADTCSRVARSVGWENWSIAYQSRSGRPSEPWLEPDILSAIGALADQGHKSVLLACPGFVCDHVEILYDLDVEAADLAHRRGMTYARAPSVGSHPSFIRLLSELVRGLAQRDH